MGIFYLFSPRVVRSITYGANPRNRLDLFIPQPDSTDEGMPYPVVIYVTGQSFLFFSTLCEFQRDASSIWRELWMTCILSTLSCGIYFMQLANAVTAV